MPYSLYGVENSAEAISCFFCMVLIINSTTDGRVSRMAEEWWSIMIAILESILREGHSCEIITSCGLFFARDNRDWELCFCMVAVHTHARAYLFSIYYIEIAFYQQIFCCRKYRRRFLEIRNQVTMAKYIRSRKNHCYSFAWSLYS